MIMGSPYRDARRGDDYAPYDLNSGQALAVWGITIGAHDNKIEVYDTEEGDGEALRDLILKLLQTSSSDSAPKWSPTPPTKDGWVLVPRVPTPEMDAAGKQALRDNGVGDLDESDAILCYSAMLAATPQPAS